MWKTLKNLVKPTVKNEIKEIIFKDEDGTEPIIIAEKLNSYYIKSIEEIVQSINQGNENICLSIN